MNNYATKEYCSLMVVNVGELALKLKNRGWFEDRLINNIRANVQGFNVASIERLYGRIVLRFGEPHPVESLKNKLCRIFGVASIAPAVVAGTALANIEGTVISCLEGRPVQTFAIRAKRIEKTLPYRSQEVNEKIGRAVLSKFKDAKVDLDNPKLTIGIDILSDACYIYLDKFKGAGGLPTGTGGKVLSLISGGIDSPVASWRMMRRGCLVSFIHFHSMPFTDSASIEKVNEICKILSEWQGSKARLIMIPFGNIQKKIVTAANEKYRIILYRRFMMRIAEALAHKLEAEALITGEALGQVASQTLSNIATVGSSVSIPILRPLIGMDKQEIVDLAKIVGTYELSIEPHQDCCQFLEPRHPVTYTTLHELAEAEASLDIEGLVKEGLTGAEWKDITIEPNE
ncbi:MAG: tRNA 4-thiouridine(8) synthase ThiI [Deltaproteobacteria bacterium]|nr:tRNA 4-thiouridine(8) synthase ThiI [Deltaproteobacteria bacterium]